MKYYKVALISIITIGAVCSSNFVLAKSKANGANNIVDKTLDSSGKLVGEAVKGTGNVIQATTKSVKKSIKDNN